MIAPRWRKALRDITARPWRSLIAVLAMAAGVFEIGTLLYAYSVLQPVLTTMYERTRPAAATLTTDTVDDALIDTVRRVPGVGDAEARPVVRARVAIGPDEWVPAVFYVIRDFGHQRMDLVEHDRGAWPPAENQILLERTALPVARAAPGGTLRVRTAGGHERTLGVGGTVHAAGLPPAWMEHVVTGFIGWDSPLRNGSEGVSEQIHIRVADHALDEGHIREVVDSVKTRLARTGHEVTRVEVPTPGRHPHADQMAAFLVLVGAFGLLSFLLSCALVATMVHAVLVEQLRQIGILKAIGATTRQAAGIYLAQVSMLAAAALAIGIPFGILAGRAYARFSAGILNADITPSGFPFVLVGAEIVAGLAVPLLVALIPIHRAAGITVREALGDSPGAPRSAGDRVGRALARVPALPRPLTLSLRTTLLRRGRLALTLGTLAMGGAVFVAALDVASAWDRAVRNDFERRRFDITVRLAAPAPIDAIAALLARVPEVVHAEYWPDAGAYLVGADGVPGAPLALVGPDPESNLLHLALIEGRWLSAGDPAGAVVNRAVTARDPSLRVGGTLRLRIAGRTVAFPIVGVVKELSPMPVVYAPRGAVLAALGSSPGVARSIRIVSRRHDAAGQLAAAGALERAFESAGIEVSLMQRMLDVRQGILDHLVIITSILLLASVVVVVVGGLTLTSTLALGVAQRTREIGVLGALGATPRTIGVQVWFESVLIGVSSWFLAVIGSAPIAWALESVTGNIFFKVPLDFYMSPSAAAIWLGLVVVLASLSGALPALRAARLTVREALAYA